MIYRKSRLSTQSEMRVYDRGRPSGSTDGGDAIAPSGATGGFAGPKREDGGEDQPAHRAGRLGDAAAVEQPDTEHETCGQPGADFQARCESSAGYAARSGSGANCAAGRQPSAKYAAGGQSGANCAAGRQPSAACPSGHQSESGHAIYAAGPLASDGSQSR